MNPDKRIVIFDGPDMCGKTQIGQALAQQTGWTYFKNDAERKAFGSSEEANYFIGVLRYGLPFLTSFLRQSPHSVILDRCYPAEWVYSRVFNRPTDFHMLAEADREFAELRADIVLLRRKSYEGIVDDTHPEKVDTAMLKKLDKEYERFAYWTKVPVHTIWVDDEDIHRELSEIYHGLWTSRSR